MDFALHRLSPGPTIPEMMRAEGEAWRRSARRRLHAAMLMTCVWACLSGAELLLVAMRALLRMRLITPDFAARVFDPAASLGRLALIFWSRSRRADRAAVDHPARRRPHPALDRRLE